MVLVVLPGDDTVGPNGSIGMADGRKDHHHPNHRPPRTLAFLARSPKEHSLNQTDRSTLASPECRSPLAVSTFPAPVWHIRGIAAFLRQVVERRGSGAARTDSFPVHMGAQSAVAPRSFALYLRIGLQRTKIKQ